MEPGGEPLVGDGEEVAGDDVLGDLSKHPARREQGGGADREQEPESHVRRPPLIQEPMQRRHPAGPHSRGERSLATVQAYPMAAVAIWIAAALLYQAPPAAPCEAGEERPRRPSLVWPRPRDILDGRATLERADVLTLPTHREGGSDGERAFPGFASGVMGS